jgi:hypothetical protein
VKLDAASMIGWELSKDTGCNCHMIEKQEGLNALSAPMLMQDKD